MTRYTVEIDGRALTIELDGDVVRVDGRAVAARLLGAPGAAVRRLARGAGSQGFVVSRGEEASSWRLRSEGFRLDALVLDERGRAVRLAARGSGAGKAAGPLRAPMPGMGVRVLVAPGQAVAAGQGMVVVEAMKMETELKAAAAGTVRAVHVGAGARVEKGMVLVDLA